MKTAENHLSLCPAILVRMQKELETGTGSVVDLSKHLTGQRTDCTQQLGTRKKQEVRRGEEKMEKRWS